MEKDTSQVAGKRLVTRRTVTRGAAWATPAVVVAGAAPAYATSLRKDPGINGWVLNSPTNLPGSCNWRLRVDSNPTPAGSTPDGAPFGLYIYDTQLTDVISNARLVYWIIGDQNASWSPKSPGHSACWSAPVRGALTTKADGLQYRPYTFTYTCPINPATATTDPDGVKRLYLGGFDTTATFTQPNNRCEDVTYWTQRFVTINGVQQTFERRNGTRGPYNPGARQRAAVDGGADVALS